MRATRDWDVPSKLRFDAIYPSVAILMSLQFRVAYWLIRTKTLVVGGTLLTQGFTFLNDMEFMYHSLNMWESCSGPTPYGPHINWCGVTSVQGGILADYDQNLSLEWDSPDIKFQLPQWPGIYVPLTLYVKILFWPTPCGPIIDWRGVTSVQGGILADYDQIDTHVLKWNPAKFSYPKYFYIWATRDWGIPSKLRFVAINPSVVILASLPFRAAYWLLTTKTLVVGGTLLTQSISLLKDREIMYHSLYMWKLFSVTMPYGHHIDWHGVTSVQGGILANYNQTDTHVLKWNPAKFGCFLVSLHSRYT